MITGDIVVLRPAAQNVPPGISLPAGPQGPSAYQLAGGDQVWGSVAAWLNSLKSTTPGPPGPMQDISGKLDKGGDGSALSVALPRRGTVNLANMLDSTALGVSLNGVFFADPGLPIYHAALWGNVVADTGVDQTMNLRAAVARIAAEGGRLILPAGNIIISGMIPVPTRVWIESASIYATHIVTAASFATGDVFVLGDYAGVRNLAFEHTQTAAQVASGELPYRTGGYTINMNGGYGTVEYVSIRHAYVGIRMGTTGGWSRVDTVSIEYLADGGTANPGSGGIVVLEPGPGVGPTNRITRVNIKPNLGDPIAHVPDFGLRVIHTGALMVDECDFTGLRRSVDIVPGDGQTAQACLFARCYFDGAIGDNVVVRPLGSGFVFHITFVDCWNTVVGGATSRGYVFSGSGATQPYTGGRLGPIMMVRLIGGLCAATTDRTATGIDIADASVVDVLVQSLTICGWECGFHAAAGASHFSLLDNRIGAYGFFGIPPGRSVSNRTNSRGAAFDAGAGDWIIERGNAYFGNLTSALTNGATGANNRIEYGSTSGGGGGSQPSADDAYFSALMASEAAS